MKEVLLKVAMGQCILLPAWTIIEVMLHHTANCASKHSSHSENTMSCAERSKA